MPKTKRKRIQIVRPDAVVAAPPGTLRPPPGSHPSEISVIAYGPRTMVERDVSDLSEIESLLEEHDVTWVNVVGLGTVSTLTALGKIFGLHGLALEDVLNVPQRPKLDDYGAHQYIVARMPVGQTAFETEQVSIFLGKRFVLTVQERPGDCFDPIRTRLRDGRPRIRGNGPDYLVYAILDALVDSYFPMLETVGARLDELEIEIHEHPEKHHIEQLHDMKRDLVTLRRYVWPLRELNSTLLRQENAFLSEKTRLYMRDCYDHSVHALDLVESYRDVTSGLTDLYMSVVSHRMNEVMKVLTIIATLFIPLSFIAGVYGMNFDPSVSRWNMPELGWTFGYPFALGLMSVCAIALLMFFWRQGWFR